MRNSIPTRDQDGNLSIQSANLDPTLHDTDPNYRKYMRDILYGKSKDILYSKINRHLVNDAELFVQSVGNVYISTTKSKFDKKKLSETQPKLNSEGNLKNVNITPNYIKNSHFTLQRSYDENFDRFNSITKLDFPPKKITKHSCISKEKCSKILSDENSLNEKKNSMQQLSYKKFHLNESDINDFKKNLKNFKKGGNIQYSNFNFGSLKMMDEEIIKELKKSEIDLNQGLINGGDAIAEKEKNKKTNSKTYVLNDPCDEFVNEYSSTQRDNFKIGVGECDKANLTVDKESFMKNIRGSHFMFGDGETFLKDSEYDSNFKNLEREEKEKLKNIKKIKEFNSNLLNENFETSNQQSTKSEDYKFKKLIQPITKCDIEKIKNLNSNNSISFGTFQDEDNLKTTSNMEYTNKLNSAFRLNNSFNIPKLKNYNTVKMDDFENISVPTSVNTENFVNYSLDQRKKIYKDNYDNNERTLKFLSGKHFDFGNDEKTKNSFKDEQKFNNKDLDTKNLKMFDNSEYEKNKKNRREENLFSNTLKNTIASFPTSNANSFETVSALYGKFNFDYAARYKVCNESANTNENTILNAFPNLKNLATNKIDYCAPEIMKTKFGKKYEIGKNRIEKHGTEQNAWLMRGYGMV